MMHLFDWVMGFGFACHSVAAFPMAGEFEDDLVGLDMDLL